MTQSLARVAVHAAKNRHNWGPLAAARYALNRGVPIVMWIIAMKFEQRRRLRASFGGYLA